MKQLTIVLFFLLPLLTTAKSFELPSDTIIYHKNKKIIIDDSNNDIKVDIFRINAEGDTVYNEKVYEGVFVGDKSVEKEYNNSFTVSIPDIFKPKDKRRNTRPHHWNGFGVGFSNLPKGFDFDGDMASIVNVSRSLQYNFNFAVVVFDFGKSNFRGNTGMGIQFNSIHFQNNKAVEVVDYKSVITTTEVGNEYRDSRIHATYLTFPLLVETSFPVSRHTHIFVNGGVVLKAKTASSSKVWTDLDGKKRKIKMLGDLNLRPITFDILVQAGINNCGIFASYSPLNLFMNNKGPKGNQATIGLQFYF